MESVLRPSLLERRKLLTSCLPLCLPLVKICFSLLKLEGGKSEESESKNRVPGEGLEPTSLLRAEDFKSSASANSATPAF